MASEKRAKNKLGDKQGALKPERKYLNLPSGKHTKNRGKSPFIVNCPNKNGGSVHSFLYVYQRVSRSTVVCCDKKSQCPRLHTDRLLVKSPYCIDIMNVKSS